MRRSTGAFALAVVLGLAASFGIASTAGAQAAGDAGSSLPAEYVGVVKGVKPYVNGVPQKDAYFLAITVNDNNEVVAYTCDGFGGTASFSGTDDNGTFSATATTDEGDAAIDATISGAHATGTLTLEGTDYDFDLKKAVGVGGLYTVSFSQAANGTVTGTGTSERGNRFRAIATRGQKRPTFTFTTVDGTTKTVTPTPLHPPKALLRFDGYRAVFLDNGRMGRGNPLATATIVHTNTAVNLNTVRVITSTTIEFF